MRPQKKAAFLRRILHEDFQERRKLFSGKIINRKPLLILALTYPTVFIRLESSANSPKSFQLFRPREDKDDSTKKNTEPPKHLVLASQQIVDCLVEDVLRSEEQINEAGGQSSRTVAGVTTLYLFAKIRPQLLVEHVQTLQPYLSITCKTQVRSKNITHSADSNYSTKRIFKLATKM